ncbi:mono/diheme cytochrome c family protein [Caulobacter sp. BE264]|uniref:c-type cytochrome n=1 Tax=Caulobacter sp. BE264 TaxID=2817724 RepID=UPI00285CFA0D|nr:cytochrome c [Caulobacter sp. BE264]MDR7229478.1 mono/diheme cytochrome c family protein [Caulobacter sp. BE264]
MRKLLISALAMAALTAPSISSAQSSRSTGIADDAIPGSPARGAAFAAKQCASCHAISADGVSPRSDAPPFGEVAKKYADYRLDWELEAIASVGHYAMPAKAMTAIQIADVTAYLRTLYDKPHDDHRRR